ncbi:MAG: polysaccharide deacetylase family protein [Oscillospiraceae bacterium]|jgi:peptidoglycan/xylan/chitin deacetylase (PgdA/CDA1 family)|nr:polysaccharide deacetylase family protein [Oscillospiraceae bacterium]
MKITKALTFSFDDGVESDRALVRLLNRYGLKCSFNLNAGLFTDLGSWKHKDFTVRRMNPFDKGVYTGHEICVHGYRHKPPTELNDEELKDEFSLDIQALETLFGEKMVGAAYAYGLYNDKAVDCLKSLGIRFARTVNATYDFALQHDLMRFHPTCHVEDERLFELAERFLADGDGLFYVWGHSYELDGNQSWDRFENFCKQVAGRGDVLYGTNTEVFRHFALI